jgi:hypothetical protein
MSLLNVKVEVSQCLSTMQWTLCICTALDRDEYPTSQLGNFTFVQIEVAATEPQGSFGHTGKLKYS